MFISFILVLFKRGIYMIKILLDTNIIIYRESENVQKDNIGTLFNIIDNNAEMVKFIHPIIKRELLQNIYENKRKILIERLKSYNMLDHCSAKINEELKQKISYLSNNPNDEIDDFLLNEIYNKNADILITEDKKMKEKALILNIEDKVMNMEEFIYKNKLQKKVNHDILDIFKVKMGKLNIEDSFFQDLKNSYSGFELWFNKKKNEEAYCYIENGKLLALLFLKNEEIGEDDYSDIIPKMKLNRKLKISTFKVDVEHKKIGERFMKIIFDQARFSLVDEIYVTIFDNDEKKKKLIEYLELFGFEYFGKKNREELVYIRNMQKKIDKNNPMRTYPFIDKNQDCFLVAIKPHYHLYLLPDSILNRESYKDIHMPVEYAIKKYYISRGGFLEKPKIGDNIVFYRTKQEPIPAKYSSVLTTIGLVTNVIIPKNSEDLCKIVKNKSVYSEEELRTSYNNNTYIIEFVYITTLKQKLNNNICMINNIFEENPISVSKITKDQFNKIIELGDVDTYFIIN